MDCRLELLGYQYHLLRSVYFFSIYYLQIINFNLGGDDLKMKAWDIRQGFDQPLFVNKRYVHIYRYMSIAKFNFPPVLMQE